MLHICCVPALKSGKVLRIINLKAGVSRQKLGSKEDISRQNAPELRGAFCQQTQQTKQANGVFIMKKKIMRLISAVLALSMALSVFPAAALADTGNSAGGGYSVTVKNGSNLSQVSTISFGADGKPTASSSDETNGWTYINSALTICEGFSADFPSSLNVDKSVTIINNGNVSHITFSGTFENYGILDDFTAYGTLNNHSYIEDKAGIAQNGSATVPVYNKGGLLENCDIKSTIYNNNTTNTYKSTVKNCTADNILNYGGHVLSGFFENFGTLKTGGKIYGGTFKKASLNGVDTNPDNAIVGGVFSSSYLDKVSPFTTAIYHLTANDCTINANVLRGFEGLKDEAYVALGDPVAHPQYITVESTSDRFIEWEGLDESWLEAGYTLKSNPVTFKMPAQEVKLTAIETKTDLADAIENGKPTKPGSKYNGWKWDGTTLTVYPGYSSDLTGKTLSCTVVNQGNLTGGAYTGTFSNTGKISNATFNTSKAVENLAGGIISYSEFYSSVSNGSTIENSNLHGGLSNNADVTSCTIDKKGVTNNASGTFTNVTITTFNLAVTNKGVITGKDGSYNSNTTNYGTIEDGTFDCVVTNSGANSKIENGLFNDRVTNSGSGQILSGTFIKSVTQKDSAQILGGIFKQDPNVDGQYTVTAPDCTFNDNENLKDTVYVVGSGQTLTVRTTNRKFNKWNVTGASSHRELPDEGDLKVMQVESSNFTSETVELSAEKYPTDVIVGDSGVPVYEDGVPCVGGKVDGWTYSASSNKLTVNDYTLDLGETKVDWWVENNDTIQSGVYTGNVTNNEDGTIENGTYSGAVTNSGIVKDGIFTGRFINNGTVEAGIFSRFAEGIPEALRLMLSGASANGISEQISVVGPHTVTITADEPDHFDHWDVSGNVDLAALKEKIAQANGEDWQHTAELTLELDSTEPSTILFTAVTEGYSTDSYPIYVFGGTATVDGETVKRAKAGQTVTVTFKASEDEKRPFLSWDVQPTTLKLNEEATNTTVTFTMVDSAVTLQAQYQDTSDAAHSAGHSSGVADGATGAVVAVAGVALASWAAYEVGTAVYAKQLLPEGAAMPKTREQLAVLLWQDAGSPLPEGAAEDATDVQKAELWVVETGLMQAQSDGSFAPDQHVSKLTVLRTFKQAHALAPQN